MGTLRYILFFLFAPIVVFGQTVHVEKNRIVYKGKVDVADVSKTELYERVRDMIATTVNNKGDSVIEDNSQKGRLIAHGNIFLRSTYYLARRVDYLLEVNVNDRGYSYRIDSVFLELRERGEAAKKFSSEDLLKMVDVTGPEATAAEKQLNEIDMNFQMLIAKLKTLITLIGANRNANWRE